MCISVDEVKTFTYALKLHIRKTILYLTMSDCGMCHFLFRVLLLRGMGEKAQNKRKKKSKAEK